MSLKRSITNILNSGNEILKENGVLNNGRFYELLPEYISQYDELKDFLVTKYSNDPLLSERVLRLPELKFEDYSNPYGLGAVLIKVLSVVFLPIGLVFLLFKNKYVSGIKDSLREINRLLSSIEMLTRDLA